MRGLLAQLPSPHPLVDSLPGLYQEDPFVQQICGGLDEVLAPVVATLDSLSAYLDPDTAPEDMLQWLGAWVGITLEGALTPARRRALVRAGVELHRWRGTARGIREAVAALYDATPEVQESGAAAWSLQANAALPGSETPALIVRLEVPNGVDVNERELDAVVAAVKPAHMPHAVELVVTGEG